MFKKIIKIFFSLGIVGGVSSSICLMTSSCTIELSVKEWIETNKNTFWWSTSSTEDEEKIDFAFFTHNGKLLKDSQTLNFLKFDNKKYRFERIYNLQDKTFDARLIEIDDKTNKEIDKAEPIRLSFHLDDPKKDDKYGYVLLNLKCTKCSDEKIKLTNKEWTIHYSNR